MTTKAYVVRFIGEPKDIVSWQIDYLVDFVGDLRNRYPPPEPLVSENVFVEPGVHEDKDSWPIERPVLNEFISGLQPGDVAVFAHYDRISRYPVPLLHMIHRIERAGARVYFANIPVDATMPEGKFMLTQNLALTEYARERPRGPFPFQPLYLGWYRFLKDKSKGGDAS